jgi:hypothetical protein
MSRHSIPFLLQHRGLERTVLSCLRLASLLVVFASATPAIAAEGPAVEHSVLPLYHALRTVQLDPAKVFKIREATLERDDLHIFLNDGLVIFTREVDGHITGMYFEGEGELLVRPPNRTEKESLGLFTKSGVLEDKFTRAYFRFNDDILAELKPFLRPPEDVDASHIEQFNAPAERLADVDALRLLASFTSGPATDEKGRKLISDHFLHARIGGSHFGLYDLFYDSRNPEQIVIGQGETVEGATYYDLWMSFAQRKVRDHKADGAVPLRAADALHVDDFKISATIHPPNDISAEADLVIKVRQGGPRVVFFELSHNLHLKQVTLSDVPVEFLQNEAIEGTQLARQGNDFVAVVLPEPCKAGDRLNLHFTYQGSVLADAGNGLLYVGAHGTWYPNFGLTPSNYNLSFTYPKGWTLVSIGKKTDETLDGEMRTSHWASERPVPVAGFNLGAYVEARATAGSVEIAAYASHGVEKDFPSAHSTVIEKRRSPWKAPTLDEINTPLKINPASTTKEIARDAASTVEFYDKLLGDYPFSSLRLTQFPGPESQGWPGLIYLSSYTFLTPQQRDQLGMNDFVKAFFGTLMLRHEVAHMWWGHEVFWDTYRDQWLAEALANYSAMLMSEQDQPDKVRILMEGYRSQLLSKRNGRDLFEAGPVTLGLRLNSAKFPDGYQTIAYGRGSWLIHMLRCMLEDGSRGSRSKAKISGDDLFVQVLRTVLQRHRDNAMSIDDFRRAFEEVLPESLRFEGRKSLDWFFDGWVNGTAIPALEVSGIKFSKQGELEYVGGTIHQKYAPDDLVTSVPVYAQAADRLEYLGRVFAVGNETHFRLRYRANGRKIVLDPYHTVLTR